VEAAAGFLSTRELVVAVVVTSVLAVEVLGAVAAIFSAR